MRRFFLVVAVAGALCALAVVVTGGIVVPFGAGVFRSRATTRPLFVAGLALLAYALSDREAFRASTLRAAARIRALAPVLALGAALMLAWHATHFGTFTAGGSDSYGYVSQAYAWSGRTLPGPETVKLTLPFPSSDRMQAPLGYRPGPQPHSIVPTYAAGLPLLMAVSLVAGPCGPFAIVPIAAAAFVLLTYMLGARLAGRMAGLIAALVVVTSPIVLFQAEWPMSDVPAAAVWTGALLASLGRTRRRAAAAGLLAALGLLLRPNLLLLAVVPFGCVVFTTNGASERIRRILLFAIPAIVAAIFIAFLNNAWYGSPLRSGYGANEEIYSLQSVWPNLQRYPVWFWQSHSPFVLLALVPLLPWISSRAQRAAGVPAAALAVVTLICYLPYFAFEDWWYVRFLLPGLGALAALMGAGLVAIARRIRAPWGHLAAVLCLAYIGWHTYEYSKTADVFGGLAAERRYVAAGQYVRTLPADAVLFSMQHSGSVRYYGGRYSLRYDFLDREWAGRAIAEVEGIGLHPYLLIDDWEAPSVRQHFGLPDGPLPWPLSARLRESGGVSVYDMATTPVAASPVAIEAATRPSCAPPMPIVLEPRSR